MTFAPIDAGGKADGPDAAFGVAAGDGAPSPLRPTGDDGVVGASLGVRAVPSGPRMSGLDPVLVVVFSPIISSLLACSRFEECVSPKSLADVPETSAPAWDGDTFC